MLQYQWPEPEGQPKILAQNLPFQHVLKSTVYFNMHANHLGELAKMRVLVQWVWSGAWDSNEVPGDADVKESRNIWYCGE